jgi:hypothetical protein
MATVAMSGSDSITINNRILNDLADGDCVALTFPNNISEVKTGKNGNSIYSLNETGKQCEVMLRLIRGSDDDKYMNNLLVQQQINFAGFVLMTGEFVKKVGDSKGNIAGDTYVLGGGIFMKQVEGKSNVEGDVEQSVSIYSMKFSSAPRAIG